MDSKRAFEQFLLWEATTRDTIDFKKAYVDMAGDLVAGLLLSQIVFWTLPDREGKSKLRVYKDEQWWIAKRREDWWDEIRITARQFDRAVKILEKQGLLVTALYKFDGAPTKHVRIDESPFLAAWETVLTQSVKSILPKGEKPSSPNGEKDLPDSVRSLTETTAETTTETTSVVVDVPDEVADRLETLASIGVENPKRDELAAKEIDPLWIEAWYLWAQDPRRRSLTNPVGNIIRKLEGSEEPPAEFLQEAEVQRRRRQRELEWAQEERQAAEDGPPEIQEEDPVPQEVQRLWSTILDELSMQMTRATFDTWLRGSRVVEASDGHLTVSVRHAYGVDWLQNRLITVIERTASRRAGRETSVTFMALTS